MGTPASRAGVSTPSRGGAAAPSGSGVRAVDPTGFFTYQQPDAYHPDWKGFYNDALERRAVVRQRFRHEVDVPYGPDAHQILDVYHPDGRTGCPVVVYFHGGRWREGHPAFYDHFAAPWVSAGAVFASCGYRLAPEHTIAEAVDDAVRAIDWMGGNAARYGGDPDRVFAAGHSSGGHLAAMATLTDRGAGASNSAGVAGLICMSAPVDLTPVMPDDAQAEELSPARRISRLPPAVVVSFGDPEPNKKGENDLFLTEQGRLLTHALTEAGASPVTVALGPADHVATAVAFADTASPLFAAAAGVVFGENTAHR